MGGKVALIVEFDENGQVVNVKDPQGEPLKYGTRETETERTIDKVGILATKNYCCWRKILDRWVCVPC